MQENKSTLFVSLSLNATRKQFHSIQYSKSIWIQQFIYPVLMLPADVRKMQF